MTLSEIYRAAEAYTTTLTGYYGFTSAYFIGISINDEGHLNASYRLEDDFQENAPNAYRQFNGYQNIIFGPAMSLLTLIPYRKVRELRFIAAKVNALSTDKDKLTDAAGLAFLASILEKQGDLHKLLENTSGEY